MPKDYTKQPLAELRRRDREVKDEAWIRTMLKRVPVGVIATSHEEQPFINSNLFVYDENAHAIYFHTARVGRTPANIQHNARVCFSVFEMGRLLPANTALEFSVEHAGVTVFGTCVLIDEAEKARAALQLLLDKYAPHLQPGRDYHPITDQELTRTATYCIHIEQWSGKKKKVGDEFPGAFYYQQQDTHPEDMSSAQ